MFHRGVVWMAALVSLYGGLARAEVVTKVSRAEGPVAFKFDNVPAASKSDAASGAVIALVDGTRDANGGEVSVLIDGAVPANEDQPRANFFFAPGTDGGRIAIDLGKPVKVAQVNTYSWHPTTRGPQVYRLYASDGAAADFNPAPKRGVDPQSVGWKSVASVDTRAKENPASGQHGASVSDTAGALGTYRYLLFDVSPTEKEDGFGNTFLSEIDVVAAEGAAEPVAATPFQERGRGNRGGNRMVWEPAGPGDPNGPPPTVAKTDAGDEITFDYSEAPELKDWVETKLKPVCVAWYPKIVGMLPSDEFAAPKKLSIAFRKEYRGVAAAAGTRINCSVDWFKNNLEGEAVGAVVHELVHVAQQYRFARGGNRNPGWLVEGVADYIRWFLYEPESARPRPRPDRANYNDSYRTTGHFLDYLTKKYDKEIVKKLNAAMRHGKYSEDLWKEITGKTAEELGAEWKQTLQG